MPTATTGPAVVLQTIGQVNTSAVIAVSITHARLLNLPPPPPPQVEQSVCCHRIMSSQFDADVTVVFVTLASTVNTDQLLLPKELAICSA